MRGTPEQLSELCFNDEGNQHLRTELKRTLRTLLYHQFVRTGDAYYQVTLGSGQGLPLSGDLADHAFYEMIEHSFSGNDRVQQEQGIHFYGRFKDDILVIASGALVVRYLQRIIRVCKLIWSMTCASVSSFSCNYLDVTIFKPPNFMVNRRLAFKPYRKQT